MSFYSGVVYPVPDRLARWRSMQIQYFNSLDRDDRKVVTDYGESKMFGAVNSMLYGGDAPSFNLEVMAAILQRIIWNAPRLPERVVVYRTVVDRDHPGAIPKWLSQVEVGQSYRMPGFQSTTFDVGRLKTWWRDFSLDPNWCCDFVIDLPAGLPVLDFAGVYLSGEGFGPEAELLLPHGLCWTLIDRRLERRFKPGNNTNVTVTVFHWRVLLPEGKDVIPAVPIKSLSLCARLPIMGSRLPPPQQMLITPYLPIMSQLPIATLATAPFNSAFEPRPESPMFEQKAPAAAAVDPRQAKITLFFRPQPGPNTPPFQTPSRMEGTGQLGPSPMALSAQTPSPIALQSPASPMILSGGRGEFPRFRKFIYQT